MKANERFLRQPRSFWANVRSISQSIGYTARGSNQVRVPSLAEISKAFSTLGLASSHLVEKGGTPTELGTLVNDYFAFRANTLNVEVEPRLLDVDGARAMYEEVVGKYKPRRAVPMNKQSGEKRAPAYLTGTVNAIIEAHSGGHPCDFDPRRLTTVTVNGLPLRTFARRLDGAFPGPVNPIAVWEIKEYYYTTTFGSRVADGVYETLLDGMEIEELRTSEGIDIRHYLIVDSHYTWWECGRSYLCRIVDMLHMGYLDEVLFGAEVKDRLPELVRSWVATLLRSSGTEE